MVNHPKRVHTAGTRVDKTYRQRRQKAMQQCRICQYKRQLGSRIQARQVQNHTPEEARLRQAPEVLVQQRSSQSCEQNLGTLLFQAISSLKAFGVPLLMRMGLPARNNAVPVTWRII